uniref:Uncharacterized protein n=1 Tax=Octopus bimaculoides TaxID=37653 RepID=A0A0L8G3M4_OCTBM
MYVYLERERGSAMTLIMNIKESLDTRETSSKVIKTFCKDLDVTVLSCFSFCISLYL